MPQIIPDIHRAWRYPSFSASALALAIQGTLTANPHALDFIPELWRHAILTGLLIWAAYDRLIVHPASPAADAAPPFPPK